MAKTKLPSTYPDFLGEIKRRIRAGQYVALQKVNKELIALYWDLGRMIVERQDREAWGASVVDKLAEDLQAEFPGTTGFSRRNLYRIRDFFLTYRENRIVPQAVAQIGWSHNVVILEKCRTSKEREYYASMAKQHGWTRNVLVHQIEADTFGSAGRTQANFHKALPPERAGQANLALRDDYTFDFLELAEDHSERELERALLARVSRFLIEMGGMFTFVGSQYRLTVGEQEFFVDLLLFHRGLRCLVAVELKVTEFRPEYAGKMQFYLKALNKNASYRGEDPAIGIILCKSKDRMVVEYALAAAGQPMGVATYHVSSKLPKALSAQLPTVEQIQRVLTEVDGGGEFVPPMVAQLKKTKSQRKVVTGERARQRRKPR
jgi:predicted nuclease of restriction endonuclease-like (RecB) superfamily